MTTAKFFLAALLVATALGQQDRTGALRGIQPAKTLEVSRFFSLGIRASLLAVDRSEGHNMSSQTEDCWESNIEQPPGADI